MNKKNLRLFGSIIVLTILMIAPFIAPTEAASSFKLSAKHVFMEIKSTTDLEKFGVKNIQFSDLLNKVQECAMIERPTLSLNGSATANNIANSSQNIIAQGGNYQADVLDSVLHAFGEEFTWPIATGVFGSTLMTRLDLTGDVRQWTSTEVISASWDYCAEVGMVYFHYESYGWLLPLVYFTTWEGGYHENIITRLYLSGVFWYGDSISLAVGRDNTGDTWHAYADVGFGFEELGSYNYGTAFMGYPWSTFECDVNPDDPGQYASVWWGHNWLPIGGSWTPNDWDSYGNNFPNVVVTYASDYWYTATT